MQGSSAAKRSHRARQVRRPRLSPYLVDEMTFTREDILRARTQTDEVSG